MSLSSALGIAQSALANSSAQSALISKNIANVSNADYSRESAGTITQLSGYVTTGATQRATSAALMTSLLNAQSASASSSALDNGLSSLATTLGLDTTSSTGTTTATDNSPATLISALQTALQQYAASPDQSALGTSAVAAAKALASNLNQASASVASVRAQADSDMTSAVNTINSLLAQFQTVNTQIVIGTRTGADVSAAQDTRDGLLKQLSTQIGITTTNNHDGGMSIYTDSGATLFETSARTVAMTPTTIYSAGTTGQAVTVDGVPVTGASAVMPIQSGALAGLATLRDTTSVAYQNQLDQMASSLITTFAESNGTGTAPGLFTATGLTGLPSASSTTGLAASLAVNASVDPSQGGNVTLLRDGGIAGSSYTYNTTPSDTGYSTRLNQLVTAMGATQSFNPSSGGAATGSLASYAGSSVSWLEAQRQSSTSQSTYNSALVSSTTTALSNATGVNLDDEMSRMLDVEHAYQASAQLMNTVNSMYSTLLQAFN
ncbi:flagellar hook-associated protein FlgK [Jatrophihabitans endophyticus]|uniref:flagellar hook-associated protein FlgK n=1 Tax=Jatrophihabitans endophyticus TaxID=1206085 RepID=UPI0019E673ED|nr:flagellar hook-associated protein FlgK [Jatrophihabitans endophyticus]MBE7190013.1 flagellar hook-associated protein FlgK [Jatrophihabitans endophyticus]